MKILAAAAFVGVTATSAFAADMAVKARPMPVAEVWNWTGFYIGGNAGYSWGRSDSGLQFFNTASGAIIAPPAGSIVGGKFDMNGAIAGGQAGYNWQTGNWVWGIEGDLQWSDEKGGVRGLCAQTGLIPGVCLPGLTFVPAGATGTAVAFDQHLEWFGTARLRGGILAGPQLLLYATGGLAYGSIKSTGAITGYPGNLAVTGIASGSDTRVGWTVGVGAEWMFARNWSAKFEYLYMDLGNLNNTFTLAGLGVPFGVRSASSFTDNIARVGINYHFAPAVVAKY
ncbi:MAG: porin family protein [Bradyrhizobium sp.]|nr:porin family protein [Bradyrhizobium sp.]